MNLNNIKTGVKLIKEIVANSKSTKVPWHKKNQIEATKKVYKPNKK